MKKVLFSCLLAGLLACARVAPAQQEYTIGMLNSTDSTPMLPMSTMYSYSYTQMMYNYYKMPNAGGMDFKINSISFYYTGVSGSSSPVPTRKIVVYMKNVSQRDFAHDSNYIPVTAADRVYAGRINITTAGWVTINLAKQFVYNNTPGNHLMIAIYDSTGDWNSRFFRWFNSYIGYYESLSYYSDVHNPNPEGNLAGFSGFRDRYEKVPVLKLHYTIDSVSAATLPYTTDFSNATDNQKWHLKGYPDYGLANWKFYQNGSNSYMYCGTGQDNYNTNGYPVTSLIERKLQLDNSDSIRISFNLTVGGEAYSDEVYDYAMVALVPISTNWQPHTATTNYTGSASDYTFSDCPYSLSFGPTRTLHSVKLSGITNQTMTTTIANPFPGMECKLVFIWRNDGDSGDGYSVRSIKNLSVTGVNRPQEYTPRSTAQWYGYATYTSPTQSYNQKFITFSMQNLGSVAVASATEPNNYAAAYVDGKVWCITKGSPRNLFKSHFDETNRFIYGGSTVYTFDPSAFTGNAISMSYNPVDGKIYFVDAAWKLYSMDLSDPEHYAVMGQIRDTVLPFAINRQGEAFGITYRTGKLLRINLNNGSTTFVGNTGISNVSYVQGMAFDYNTGELFWAHCGDSSIGDMYYVDVNTGEAKYIGKLDNRAQVELTGLFTPFSSQPQGIAAASATKLCVYPNPAKEVINVAGVENGTLIKVYDMTGKLVVQQTATENTQINVSGLNKGVYVIAAGEHKVKFAKQ